jgi:leucyl/phenylalanyl-tRNA--protein transferase
VLPPSTYDWGFPEPHEWSNDDDVVAVGADLAPNTLLYAYSHGMFPMYVGNKNRDLGWWSPVARGVIPLHELRITRSMKQSARKCTVTFNQSFAEVMQHCASAHTEGQWITQEFIDAYSTLHTLGHAHSVEVWDTDHRLVGGLYGVRINNFFAGESMFHLQRDASKVAVMHLVDAMNAAGMSLLDTQWCTDHLATLGCVEVPRTKYLELLAQAIAP